jgi:PAS domain S-box-containing protein
MKSPSASDPAALRRAAEARMNERSPAGVPQTMADLRRLQHELEVHQIELEMQNEELRATRDELAAGLERYIDLYDFAPVGYLTLDRDGKVLAANLMATRLLGLERATLLHRRLAGQIINDDDRRAFLDWLERTFTSGLREACEVAIARERAAPLMVRFEAVASEGGHECRAVLLDVSERHRAEAERIRLIEQLTRSLSEVKELGGLLPICGYCKKIRDDQNYWHSVESYIATHTNAKFSHSICPECERKIVQPELNALLRQAGVAP